MKHLSAIALIMAVSGISGVILPTFRWFEKRIINQKRKQSLEEGRRKLTLEGSLYAGETGFKEVKEIIESEWDGTLISDCEGFHIPRIGYSTGSSKEMFSSGTIVYAIGPEGPDEENPIADSKSKEIESLFAINAWIDDSVRRLVDTRIQRVRAAGFILLATSVFLENETALSIIRFLF